jgi:uncharacterized membrane protein
MAIGFACVYFVHREILRRLSSAQAYIVVQALLLLCGIGIYLGRVLRWNTWDVILHPVALMQDVIAGLFMPTLDGVMIVGTFFVLLAGLYAAIWQVCRPG